MLLRSSGCSGFRINARTEEHLSAAANVVSFLPGVDAFFRVSFGAFVEEIVSYRGEVPGRC